MGILIPVWIWIEYFSFWVFRYKGLEPFEYFYKSARVQIFLVLVQLFLIGVQIFIIWKILKFFIAKVSYTQKIYHQLNWFLIFNRLDD